MNIDELAKLEKQSKQKPAQDTRNKDGEYRSGAAQQFERYGWF